MFSIDRFEENIAVCEDENKKTFDILVSLLPQNAKEGDCFQEKEPGVFIFLPEETSARRNAIAAKLKALLNR